MFFLGIYRRFADGSRRKDKTNIIRRGKKMIAQIIYAIVLIFGFLSLLENMKLEEKNKDLKKEIYEVSRKNAELAIDNLKLTIEIEEMKKEQ